MNTTEKVLQEFLEDNKIKIPNGTKRVNLDVGTSRNAPFSEFWLQKDNELCVFGFEPNIYNISNIKQPRLHGYYQINTERINNSFFCINCALSNYISEKETFYCAEQDGGTSSLFKPLDSAIIVKEITEVPVITLESFFDFFPWEKIEKIDQIKIDAQSSDFNIIKGIGKYLSERVVYLDVETTTENQYDNIETPNEIKDYMENHGFECLKWGLDATFFNKRFENIKYEVRYSTLH